MNAPLHRFLTLSLSVAMLVGCRKKEVVQVAEEREATLPVEERVEIPPARETPSPEDAKPVEKLPAIADFSAEAQAFDAWCARFKLDPSDPKMLEADPDSDGYSNREEFVAGTSPLDAHSRPGIHGAIRLKEYSEARLPVVLEAVDGGKARIKQIADDGAKPQVVKSGDTVPGLSLKVERVEEKHDTDKSGNAIDISNVTLEDPATKERVVLIKGLPAKTAATYATLASDDGKTSLKVRLGDTFEWPSEPGAHYKVLDMGEDQVVVQHVETRKTWTIVKE